LEAGREVEAEVELERERVEVRGLRAVADS
jgi:hypothetical protein